MPVIDANIVTQHFQRGDRARTTTEKGKALEDLVEYIFTQIPGVTLSARNQMNQFNSSEIDVAFWNDCDPDGLQHFDNILLVECKNWNNPIGYPELAIFKDKLESRGRPIGILVAANGITGNHVELTAAHGVIARCLQSGLEIIVITRVEIEGLADTDQLIHLLKMKRAKLAVSGSMI